jgi:hypothetical protein
MAEDKKKGLMSVERRDEFNDLTLAGAVSFKIADGVMNVTITIYEKGSDKAAGQVTQQIPFSAFFDSDIGFPDERDRLPHQVKGVILSHEFAQAVSDNFIKNLRDVLTEEAIFHAADCISLVLMDTGLENVEKQEVIDAHLKRTEDRLRKWLKVPRGQQSKWDKTEMLHSLRIVLDRLPRNAAHDLAAACEGLKILKPDKAPASADSLRMLLTSLGIDWKAEKTAALKRKVKSPHPFEKT